MVADVEIMRKLAECMAGRHYARALHLSRLALEQDPGNATLIELEATLRERVEHTGQTDSEGSDDGDDAAADPSDSPDGDTSSSSSSSDDDDDDDDDEDEDDDDDENNSENGDSADKAAGKPRETAGK
eukprot:TRINITY_DN4301_c0_g1_i1.p1 TRINITY_DN4301_c0_g1~~TRINITY_DN4301_c0_g1_i1.p1  ORF type:complete len:128 (+),score=52.77 TRINITY_DN4301_c0_g1_i1:88-471(+)